HHSVFEEQLPGAIPRLVTLAAPDAVARLAQHLQLLGDIASPFYGVASRDEKKQSAEIFFSCRDPVIGPQSLSLAAQIVYHLAQGVLTADRLAELLNSCSENIPRHALEAR